MLILTIVCTAWLEIIGIQSAKKEARRREAVERLAGMMDAFMHIKQPEMYVFNIEEGFYEFTGNDFIPPADKPQRILPMFGEDSPIGYRLKVVQKYGLDDATKQKDMSIGWENDISWPSDTYWLIGSLYNSFEREPNEAGNEFFTLSSCLGIQEW